ncbi:hypothetical protein [uncultured Sphingomonas sp.]|uniref:hypothetical protein n=2 Tax=Sphingomonas TaxID=13687 RepID=UPI0035CC342D
MKDGRPLRFLGSAAGGWTLFRVAALWPAAETLPLRALARAVLPPVLASTISMPLPKPTVDPATPVEHTPIAPIAAPVSLPTTHSAAADIAAVQSGPQSVPARTPGVIGPPLRPGPVAGPGRLAGSAWMLARGGPSGTLSGGQLGASQAGVRLTYALDAARRVAIAARLATPLSGRGKEAAIGLDWKPTRLPFHLIAEQRFVLDGGKGGPTIGIIGGYGPGLVAPGVRVEAYGQAGAIARGGVEGFVDAAARATHPLVDRGPVRIDIGAGVWGSAQKGAARFDLGPTIGAVVPVGRRTIRLSADWRERIAGDARPGSGPAFTIGSDF